jgi:hypothetical protein
LKWAFTSTHTGNWHPLTWLSHMLDCQFFGLKPGSAPHDEGALAMCLCGCPLCIASSSCGIRCLGG